ncbi:MAG TPA: site-2 protease family protein [Clostridia bacterium]|nr:site-2 protease family protein [Clostridia bacterium]
MPGGFRIGRIFGIEIDINWSWIFIFLLVTFDLAVGVFPALHPEWSPLLNWGLGIAASLLFFSSVLAHEIAHSLVARSRGLPVDRIVLFIFGGVSNIEREPASAGTEFLMAIVGPLTSIVLGVFFLFLGVASAGGFQAILLAPGEILAGLSPLSTLLLWLGPINILLGLFNLLPGFPLDGGRVFRSIIWAITNDLKRATRYASWVGQGFGWLFVAIGIAMVFGIAVPFFGASLIGGFWLIFIGWFLASIASQGYEQVVIEDVLKDVSVSQIMRTRYPSVSPQISVNQLVNEHIMGTEERTFPVMEGKQLLGIVSLDDVRKVTRDRWQEVKVEEIMTSRDELKVVGPKDGAVEALRIIAAEDINQLPVVEDSRLIGIISRRDIILWLQLRSEGKEVSVSFYIFLNLPSSFYNF